MPNSVGIVGGGLMGSGIAYAVLLKSEAPVALVEQDEQLVNACRGRVERFIQGGVERGLLSEPKAVEMKGRVRYLTDLAAIGPAEIVIEAVFEDLGLKQEIFRRLDQLYDPGAVLASNTSGLPITQIASATRHPERVIGTHFFNPVPAMKLVEIVRGDRTADQTLAFARRFCEGLGKEVIVSLDRPGFITTRIWQALFAEALRCLEEGVGTLEDIDKGIRLAYNYPMGPFQLADLVGLDTLAHILKYLEKELGQRFDPGPVLRRLIEEKRFGRKTGGGFFEY